METIDKVGGYDEAVKSYKQQKYIMTAMVLLRFYFCLSSTGVTILLSSLLTGYNALQYYALVVVANGILLVVGAPIGGKLGDIIGRKKLILFGLSCMMVSTIVLVMAPNIVVFVIGYMMLGGVLWPDYRNSDGPYI